MMKDGGGGYNVWATTHQELYILVAHHRQPQQMDTAWSWMDGDSELSPQHLRLAAAQS